MHSLQQFSTDLDAAIRRYDYRVQRHSEGQVLSFADGVAQIRGLPAAKLDELLEIDGVPALAIDLLEDRIGAAVLSYRPIHVDAPVRTTGRVASVPVGEALLGRVIDPLGTPLDSQGALENEDVLPIDRPAPTLVVRQEVTEPLVTQIAMIDSLFPIGRGQRQLILGDRGTGKTTLATDTMINQRNANLRCVYVAIGQMASDTMAVLKALKSQGAMANTVVVIGPADAPPGVRFLAPYAGCTIAEWFRDRGEDALIIYDDLTAHAIAYRELSLLLRRPPGREAFPGDIFFIHSRLLERATRISVAAGGGSLTALPIVQTRAGRISDFIPTNIISITDGQLVLDRSLFELGVKPAIDVGVSVSRVGAKTQPPSLRSVSGKLKLDLTRFMELEVFTRFGTQLEEETKRLLNRGARARALLKQSPGQPVFLHEQVIRLLALNEGLLDQVPIEMVLSHSAHLVAQARKQHPALLESLEQGRAVTEEDRRILGALS